MRYLILISALAVCLNAVGCCGPMGCGPGCKAIDANCCDCDGGCGQEIPNGPLDALRQWRRSLVCGGGCGEVYYGEWRSTPPDCADPCCGEEFVGGAVKCTPFCWQPGALLPNLYGRRVYESGTPCDGCGDCGSCDICDSGCDGGCASCGSVVEGTEYLDSAVPATQHHGGCGCASCRASSKNSLAVRGSTAKGQRMVKAPPLTGSRPMRSAQRDEFETNSRGR